MLKESFIVEPFDGSIALTKTATIYQRCNGCGLCQKECQFLQTHGMPGIIAGSYARKPDHWQATAFECSLCGLCSSVCPQKLDPSAMFLYFRQQAVRNGKGNFPEHQRLINYERKGTSQKYSLYCLPEHCDTVFFPGCSFTGTRPDMTLKTYDYLKIHMDYIGIVLDCCTKPSHDLGRQDDFEQMFFELKETLLEHQIRTIVVACPNCHKIFKTYAPEFKIETVYEVMARNGVTLPGKVSGSVVLHDPCPVRFEPGIHESVRTLVRSAGLRIVDTPHTGEKTVCCGEGGAVGCMSPEFAQAWTEKRVQESNSHQIVSYCAGCVNMLSKKTETFHVIDLIFSSEKAMEGKAAVSGAPFTYLNRLRLKKTLKKQPVKTMQERMGTAGEKRKHKTVLRLALFVVMIAAIAGIRAFGLQDFLDQEKLVRLMQSSGHIAPVIYMLLYTVAPALFLPGLPITIAGGLLFGPFWGVVYTMAGATAGAGIAFLISRYVSSDFIQAKMNGPKWIKFQNNVEQHGWKMVAMTRLIPLFPFNLLNYAFGLTRIKFSHYIITTFICMMPACIAFIVFSSSLVDLFHGRLSKELIAGAAMIVMVSLIPVVTNKFFRRNKIFKTNKKG